MKRLFVLGLDGFPYSLLKKMIEKGDMLSLKEFYNSGCMKPISSAVPVVSSVAWTSFATGTDASEHGITGFIDRELNPFHLKILTSKDRKVPAIWEVLGQKRRVIVINVPITYPVEKVNGIMVSCFLCPDIKKGVYPFGLADELIEEGYIIDANADLVNESREKFLYQLLEVMDKRFEMAFRLLEREEWEYFQLHIMETDRLFHFFWNDLDDRESPYHSLIQRFFLTLNQWIERLKEKLEKEDGLIVMSDHGFCGIKYEVQLNTWLEQKGYLKFQKGARKDLPNYDKSSLCYSILPGRIFVNLQGREERGSVCTEDYEKIRQKLKKELSELKDPDNGQRIIKEIWFQEELYQRNEHEQMADIILQPENGYDLKGSSCFDKIFTRSNLTGMHTLEDAVLIGHNIELEKVESIDQIYWQILKWYEEE